VHYPCAGSLGDECAFSCDHGYVAIGRHVCQTYAAGGTTFINSSYFGGRCERLCSGAPTCSASEAAIRVNTTDPLGACFSTRCLSSADAALRKLARGNVEVWRRARHNTSGLYMDGVNLVDAHWTTTRASTGVTGLGLMMEVVAHALGWQKLVALEERVTLTLRTLIGRTPGVAIPRDDRGFFVHFVDAATGAQPGPADSSCLMCSGLLMAGALFTRSYLEEVDPDGAHEVGRLVQDLWDSIEFDKLLCDTSRDVVSPKNGSGIPMTLAIHGDACPNGFQTPQKDGTTPCGSRTSRRAARLCLDSARTLQRRPCGTRGRGGGSIPTLSRRSGTTRSSRCGRATSCSCRITRRSSPLTRRISTFSDPTGSPIGRISIRRSSRASAGGMGWGLARRQHGALRGTATSPTGSTRAISRTAASSRPT
jgi:hypothetical protein